jgi:hypothetical protein
VFLVSHSFRAPLTSRSSAPRMPSVVLSSSRLTVCTLVHLSDTQSDVIPGTTPQCEELGRQVLVHGRHSSPQEVDAQIAAITADRVRSVASKYIYDKCPSVAAYGMFYCLLLGLDVFSFLAACCPRCCLTFSQARRRLCLTTTAFAPACSGSVCNCTLFLSSIFPLTRIGQSRSLCLFWSIDASYEQTSFFSSRVAV